MGHMVHPLKPTKYFSSAYDDVGIHREHIQSEFLYVDLSLFGALLCLSKPD